MAKNQSPKLNIGLSNISKESKRFFVWTFGVMILVFLVSIPTVLFFGNQQAELVKQATAEELYHLSDSINKQYQLYIDRSETLASALRSNPNILSKNSQVCNNFLKEEIKFQPEYTYLSVVNLNGDVTCSSAELSTPMNLSDKNFFNNAVKNNPFSVGEFQIDKITGLPVLPFGYPIVDEKGHTVAILAGAVNLKWLDKTSENLQLPDNSQLLIINKEGTILVDTNNLADGMGKSALDLPVVKNNLGKAGPVSVESKGLDGVNREYLFQSFNKSTDTYMVLGLSNSPLLAKVRSSSTIRLLIVIVLGLTSLILTWIIGRKTVLLPLSKSSLNLSLLKTEAAMRYESLIKNAPDPIIALNKKGIIVEANNKAAELSGKPLKELIGKSFTKFGSLVSPKDIPLIGKRFSEMVMGKKIAPYDLELITAKGKKTFQVNIVEVKFGDETLFQIIMRDVTERSKNQADLEARTQELEKINKIMTERELVMVRLKEENEDLKKRLKQ